MTHPFHSDDALFFVAEEDWRLQPAHSASCGGWDPMPGVAKGYVKSKESLTPPQESLTPLTPEPGGAGSSTDPPPPSSRSIFLPQQVELGSEPSAAGMRMFYKAIKPLLRHMKEAETQPSEVKFAPPLAPRG